MKTKSYIAYFLVAIFMSVVFTACGGGGSGSTTTTNTGVLKDNNVSGVSYTAGTRTGTTDAQGRFSYFDGETITFTVGGMIIGEIQASSINSDSVVYPTDLVGVIRTESNNTKVMKILQVLQSLDSDGDPSNGIDINTTTRNLLENVTYDFREDVSIANLNTIVNTVGVSLISEASALSHFRQTLADDGVLSDGSNSAPVATFDAFQTTEDVTYTGILTATDSDGDTLTYSKVTDPSNGALSIDTNGSFTYTPTTNYFGNDSFTYKASDDTNDSENKTVSITIVSQNDAPVGSDQTKTTNEDTTLTFTASDFTDGFSDVEGDTLQSIRISTLPSNGILKLSGTNIALNDDINASDFGNITYVPNTNYNGSDSFKGYGYDGTSFSNQTTMNITIASIDDTPVATFSSFTTPTDANYTSTLTATDGDNDTLTFTKVSDPSNGTITLDTNGSFTYTPTVYRGSDSFTYSVSDGSLTSGTVTVNVTVTPLTHGGVTYGAVLSPITGKYWLDRNLGASQVCTSSTDSNCYGDYYQWGRNADGHQLSTSSTTTTPSSSISNVGHENFIIPYDSYYDCFLDDWLETTGSCNSNIDYDGSLRATQWSKTDGSSICPVGYRVPDTDELQSETIDDSIQDTDINGDGNIEVTNRDTAFKNFLKVPSSGIRSHSNGSLSFQAKGSNTLLWVNSVATNSSRSKSLYIDSNNALEDDGDSKRSYGVSVRCIKD